jgi:hypothetical protein
VPEEHASGVDALSQNFAGRAQLSGQVEVVEGLFDIGIGVGVAVVEADPGAERLSPARPFGQADAVGAGPDVDQQRRTIVGGAIGPRLTRDQPIETVYGVGCQSRKLLPEARRAGGRVVQDVVGEPVQGLAEQEPAPGRG